MRTIGFSRVAVMLLVLVAAGAISLAAWALPGGALAASTDLMPAPAVEVQAASELSDVTLAEARSNLAIQHRASQVNVVGQLEEGLGDSFAGVYFDNGTGEFVVPVATAGDGRAATATGEDAVEEEFSTAGLDADYRTEVVRYSHEELETAQAELAEELAAVAEGVPTQTAIDPEADAIEISIPYGTSTDVQIKIEAAAVEAGVHTEIVKLGPEAFEANTDACNLAQHVCDQPVRGGIHMWGGPQWLSEGEMVEENCTIGFRANGYEGRKYLLTAGHCMTQDGIPNGQPVWSWQTADAAGYWRYIGRSAQWRFPRRDWAKIDATATWADQAPWPTEAAYWGSTEEYPVVGEARAYVGETLCHIGYRSGTSCGVVSKENAEVEYDVGTPRQAKMFGMFKAVGPELNAIGGDSGGPVVANNIALGVLSGSGSEGPGHTWIFFNDITEATAELGVDIAGPGITEAITGSSSNVGAYEATLTGQVDPHGSQTEYAVEWGLPGNLSHLTTFEVAGAGQGFVPVSKTITGLEPATTYQYRLMASNGFGQATGAVGSFTTSPIPPTAWTVGTEEVKKGAATLVGAVIPNGEPTTYQFEYGTTTAYGSVTPSKSGEVGAGRTTVTLRRPITGLKDGTTYHFRIKATNSAGTSYGSDLTFRTPSKPSVTAEEAAYVNTLEPTMKATIYPERAATTYQFEYGTTETYGTKVPVPAEAIGWSGALGVEQGLKGLQRSTTYHYRVVATNEVGTTYGADRSFTTLPPCKGAEAKCAWSLQGTSNPLPSYQFELKGVSCASASSCVAVGKNLYDGHSFVDRWNGSSWSLLSGTVTGDMKHLSCLASGCFVVGTAGGAAQTWWVGEIGGVSTWVVYPMTPPLPAGASETKLEDVDCPSVSECTAVGSYKGSEGVYHPLVERWNGTAWSLQSAPNPAEGTAQNAMLSVSCISVGCITVGEAAGKPVAETWMGGIWALAATPKMPAGAKAGKLSAVSCYNLTCLAVGNSNEGFGTEKPLAETFVNGVWTLTSAPSPSGAKGFVELAGVSCASASACTATGYYASSVSGTVPLELKTLTESWSGTAWSIKSSPNASGQAWNLLTDVSCGAAGACTAVGRDTGAVGQAPESLAERWDGSTWSTQTIVNPELPVENELKTVSCASNTLCVGTGKNLSGGGGFIEVWNGTEWMVASNFAGEMRDISCGDSGGCVAVGVKGGVAETWLVVPIAGSWAVVPQAPSLPAGATEIMLAGIQCLSTSYCLAVGSFKGSEGAYHTLVERWRGGAWSVRSAPDPAEGSARNAMLSISCAEANVCVAVGEAAGKPFAETFAEGEWSRAVTPLLPAGAKGATLVGVSCGSLKVCTAVGDSYEGAGSEKPLAERWNAGAWSIASVPAPAGAKGYVNLTDVSCLSPNACFAAGSYAAEISGGVPVSLKTMVAGWDGIEWSVLPTPNVAGQAYDSLTGISCTTSIDCTAVGGAFPNLNKRPPVQVAMRFE